MKVEKDKNKIKLNSEKINRREKQIKVLKLSFLISALFLIIIFFLLRIAYTQGPFTVSLGQDFAKKSGLIIYENPETKESRRILEATRVEFMDNISVNWLPKDIQNMGNGSHNGDNYLAYTFYIENQGIETVNYWYSIFVDDVIKNVDRAVRVMMIINDDKRIYAKPRNDGSPERGTEVFRDSDCVMLECRKNFEKDAVDKITVVIFIEGDDPECTDDLIGGEMKMHLEIDEEHILQKKVEESQNDKSLEENEVDIKKEENGEEK